jgi:CHAD domain-containing protein
MPRRSPLRDSLSRRRRALAKHVPAALDGDSHAVHEARVASRRVRETLPVVGADLDDKVVRKLRRRIRRVTRGLGPVRELEVALAWATARRPRAEGAHATPRDEERWPVEPDAHRTREQLEAFLRERLDEARARLRKLLDAERVERWLEQIEGLEEALAESRAGVAWRSELADRLERRAARLQTALDEAGLLFVAERLHAVRIALKRLRYAVELAGELRVASTAATVRGLKEVQDVLGALHDHDVLMGYVTAAAEQPGLDASSRDGLLALNGALESERHTLHARFLARRSALVRLHDRAIDVAARARTQRRVGRPARTRAKQA